MKSNQPGEVRGQIGERGFTAQLNSAQEVPTPTTPSNATGTGAFRLNAPGAELKFDITVCDLTGPILMAHFHKGVPGVAGGVVRTLTDDFDGNTASGVWNASDSEPLTGDLVNDLIAGNLYVNVHTTANQPGEIRGQVNTAGFVTSVERDEDAGLPQHFSLFQNYPNPFNPTTEIRFDLNRSGRALLKVYNVLGQLVGTLVDQQLSAGSYKLTFDSKTLPAGVYIYELESNGITEARKMTLLK